MADWTEIEDRLVEYLGAIPEVLRAFDHEPMALGALPCTTLLVRLFSPQQASTGYSADLPTDDVAYGWRLRLYVPLIDYKRAQEYIKVIAPQIIAINRLHPTAEDLVDFLRVSDPGDTPTFSHEDKWAYKDWDVIAVREEHE